MEQKKKRTLKEVRTYITRRAVEANNALGQQAGVIHEQSISPSDKQIAGLDLQRAAPALNKITDEIDRRKIEGLFAVFSKYQALAMILDAGGEWFKKYPQQMQEVGELATQTDVEAEAATRIP